MSPSPLTASPEILALLRDLHTRSLTQEATVDWLTLPAQCTAEFDSIMLDKFIALDQDKSELVYHILRSINAKTVVEAGTSFGVSTIYLALAVAENAKRVSATTKPQVIATEKEESKAKLARAHWAKAGKEVENVIDLRVGDLRETLTSDLGTVDFLLLDIWTPLALPALKLVQPHFRPGAVIVADNTVMAADRYQELFAYVDAEGSGFRRVTLPYKGGLDMIIYQ
ncbi:O-methyltransferase, family 3 [Penicillium italicum]|uniref:O-methyltransferase, family 3 n=1 Tax=Penicillium italicum TaxID=40296 RepID=A0A0A2KR25_PENIT|nr:O-methyltransferase, family 3 [Penicillium italicum]